MTFTRCDGSIFSVPSTCSCQYGRSWVCDNDGGSYPFQHCADGSSCTCSEPDSSNGAVTSSVACACQQMSCPTYDVAVAQCSTGTISTYAGCNLVAVERKLRFRTTTFVYDATTRDLVGARYESDTAHLTCGANVSVSRLEGGVFPAAICAVTSTQVCGDASTN